MSRLLVIAGVLCTLAAFAAGVVIGMRAGSAAADRTRADAAEQATRALTARVNADLAQRQHELADSAEATAKLERTRRTIAVHVTGLDDAINTARFQSVAAPACSVGGGAHPAGSAEFVRLYNRAARGGEPASAASAGAGGMPAAGAGRLPEASDAAAG